MHSPPTRASNIEIVKGSSALINATSEVGEAVRAGNAVIQTSKNKLETEPLDLNDILEEINKEFVEIFEFFPAFNWLTFTKFIF